MVHFNRTVTRWIHDAHLNRVHVWPYFSTWGVVIFWPITAFSWLAVVMSPVSSCDTLRSSQTVVLSPRDTLLFIFISWMWVIPFYPAAPGTAPQTDMMRIVCVGNVWSEACHLCRVRSGWLCSGYFVFLLCKLSAVSAVLNHILIETRIPSMPLGNHCPAETQWITFSAQPSLIDSSGISWPAGDRL